MGTITESFGNLSEYLLAERKSTKNRHAGRDLLFNHVLKTFMPAAVRYGTGTITDIKDRQVGPLDIIVSGDSFPAFSEGTASSFLSDGVIFVLQARNWSEYDLTEFGQMATLVKGLQGKRKNPIPCLAVSYDTLPLAELSQFLKSKSGVHVDGILCIGHHVILRNSLGWYGDPVRVPFVTERPGPEALKSFVFFLLHLTQTALGKPFGLADYQHL